MEENWKERALKAEATVRKQNGQITMTYFCMRVDSGEVRSKKTEVTNCD